jgi:Domain of unknown function (DUF4267)
LRSKLATISIRQGHPVKIGSLPSVLSLLITFGIIFIGIHEFLRPSLGAQGYGVPLLDPSDGDLLAIKAVRDIVSGILVLAFLGLRDRKALAYTLGVMTLIPVFDGLIVVRHAGWIFNPVVSVHWGTAAFMVGIVALLRREK